MATAEAVSEGTLERQKATNLSRYRTCYLHSMLKQAKLSNYCLIKSVEGKTFWIHGHLQTRTEVGQESKDMIFSLWPCFLGLFLNLPQQLSFILKRSFTQDRVFHMWWCCIYPPCPGPSLWQEHTNKKGKKDKSQGSKRGKRVEKNIANTSIT